MRARRRIARRARLPLWLGAAALLALAAWLGLRREDHAGVGDPAGAMRVAPDPALVERGRYLALAGNCAGCHTERGGTPYAGGEGLPTPFGTVYPGNLTPDPETGLGRWSAGQFWRAMHEGRSRDGRLLYPVFPYPSYTKLTREDSDAIFAWLRSLPPVSRPNREHRLRFPYDTQLALAAWRALFFSPGSYRPDSTKSAQWNRGAYLVQGPGHCESCHSPRNALGATRGERLEGGLIPSLNWYAPSLASPDEAGVADWPLQEIVQLLGTGVSPRASMIGPMADVVFASMQHLTSADLEAIAVYLKALPQPAKPREAAPPRERRLRGEVAGGQGARIYEEHCADCHGASGLGAVAGGATAYPALAGNRAVTMDSPANAIQVVLAGGYPPATAGNPRPWGMPPFAHLLGDGEIAAVVSFIRGAWGNAAAPVSQLQVQQYREGRGR